jgi:hypothetical protein
LDGDIYIRSFLYQAFREYNFKNIACIRSLFYRKSIYSRIAFCEVAIEANIPKFFEYGCIALFNRNEFNNYISLEIMLDYYLRKFRLLSRRHTYEEEFYLTINSFKESKQINSHINISGKFIEVTCQQYLFWFIEFSIDKNNTLYFKEINSILDKYCK